MTDSSMLWDALVSSTFKNIDNDFLADFRATGSANKFVAWDPYEHSTRYYKFLMYSMAQRVPEQFFEAYRKIENIELGNPLSIRYSDCNINADYFSAVEEWEFLSRSVDLENGNVKNIVEIGAGFGRTCHTILSLSPDIESYTIIDLEPMLELSSAFLKRVIPEMHGKINYISSEDKDLQDNLSFDLVVNIDSFQEMPKDVIDDYMSRIVGRGTVFYSKNAVGKYLPETIGMPALPKEKILDVFELGRCTDVIDIFDSEALRTARDQYIRAYKPEVENNWAPVADEPMIMFPYFHHVVYKRN